VIRVPVPPMTEERRRDVVKHLKRVLEEHRTAVRNVRRDGNDALKKLAKDKKISEDDEKRALDEVQKMTDQEILRMEELSAKKEIEVMQVDSLKHPRKIACFERKVPFLGTNRRKSHVFEGFFATNQMIERPSYQLHVNDCIEVISSTSPLNALRNACFQGGGWVSIFGGVCAGGPASSSIPLCAEFG